MWSGFSSHADLPCCLARQDHLTHLTNQTKTPAGPVETACCCRLCRHVGIRIASSGDPCRLTCGFHRLLPDQLGISTCAGSLASFECVTIQGQYVPQAIQISLLQVMEPLPCCSSSQSFGHSVSPGKCTLALWKFQCGGELAVDSWKLSRN